MRYGPAEEGDCPQGAVNPSERHPAITISIGMQPEVSPGLGCPCLPLPASMSQRLLGIFKGEMDALRTPSNSISDKQQRGEQGLPGRGKGAEPMNRSSHLRKLHRGTGKSCSTRCQGRQCLCCGPIPAAGTGTTSTPHTATTSCSSPLGPTVQQLNQTTTLRNVQIVRDQGFGGAGGAAGR